jgi:hypothetical protein
MLRWARIEKERHIQKKRKENRMSLLSAVVAFATAALAGQSQQAREAKGDENHEAGGGQACFTRQTAQERRSA